MTTEFYNDFIAVFKSLGFTCVQKSTKFGDRNAQCASRPISAISFQYYDNKKNFCVSTDFDDKHARKCVKIPKSESFSLFANNAHLSAIKKTNIAVHNQTSIRYNQPSTSNSPFYLKITAGSLAVGDGKFESDLITLYPQGFTLPQTDSKIIFDT